MMSCWLHTQRPNSDGTISWSLQFTAHPNAAHCNVPAPISNTNEFSLWK